MSNGMFLEMTDNHRVVSGGTKIEIKDAKTVDKQNYEYRRFDGIDDPYAILSGRLWKEPRISGYWKAASSEAMSRFLYGFFSSYYDTSTKSFKEYPIELLQDIASMVESLGIGARIYQEDGKNVIRTTTTATNPQSFSYSLNVDEVVEIVSSEYIGDFDVFDFTVEAEEHTVMINGLLVSNCAELALSEEDACSIGSVYLPAFINNPWSNFAMFDFDRFEDIVRLATRIQDNVREYDMDYLPLESNKIPARLGRRIGIGIHGLADALAALGCSYGSSRAVEMTDAIMGFMKNYIYRESVILGMEKGIFPAWDWSKEKDNSYLNSLDHFTLEYIEKHGRRNIACQTIAPTGSISIISRNCSSGIEPIFRLAYTRSVKKQGSEETDQLTIYHQAAQDCIDAGGDISVFLEANSIAWDKRIAMQAACQRNIDHSISSTVNLPEGTTEETVSNIYMEAWKAGLKGITVYVDGSRTGVLVSNEIANKTKKRLIKTIERPKTTEIDIHKVKYKDKPWAVLVGKVDGRPCECFAGIEEDTPLPNKYHKAELTKKSRGHYSLTVYLSEDADDIIRISNIGARFPAPEGMALTRMISMSLRNGVPLSEITDQLSRAASSIFDHPAILNRVLKQYITEEEYTESIKGKTCPDCGSELKARREGGCMTEYCDNGSCNYINSKCS